MVNKMLIDASHPEETRVVVMRGDRVEEFDFESALRKQLRGNIYLAKVTRVEPSLQAAFVDYGGNRHGFLAFNEIHPDYYQLPKADRDALLQYEAEEARNAAKREAEAESLRCGDDDDSEAETDDDENLTTSEDDENENSEEMALSGSKGRSKSAASKHKNKNNDDTDDDSDDDDDDIESVGSEDALEELPVRQSVRRKHYKIQEVIKRRQIILVQVVKEERGNKGAALTTYLSLAGRYTVLMPNTARGGGISRKIANPTDRKRLRKIVAELEVPEGMGLIVRTAGASRTKAELKRDFEYLLRLWENVRDLTLQSSAPSLVYEEGNLIKRSIRDLYSKEIEEVLVAGEEEYREAKDFMRMLMPSHAKNVQPYKESEPLFTRYKIEAQLNAMYSPYVTLPSGGYIVINQTEALVSVDVNSGRSTKEHSIEETALNTNLEAATEISRQLRLRDLAGLVVIDFIDMEERRNNRAVERRVKECLRHDRARIQVGRISHFGLMEMSRQRLRTGVLEGSTSPCPHCTGTGMIRSTESMALTILRALEDRLITQRDSIDLACNTNVDVALYILNNKRGYVNDIERRYGVTIAINASQDLEGVSYTIEQSRRDSSSSSADNNVVQMDWAHKSVDNELTEREDRSEQEGGKSRRRRRRRGGQSARRDNNSDDRNQTDANSDSRHNQSDRQEERTENQNRQKETTETSSDNDNNEEEGRSRRPRRRGKRGGRRRGNRANRDQNSETQSSDEINTEDAGNQNEHDQNKNRETGDDHEIAARQVSDEGSSATESSDEKSERSSKPRQRRQPRRRSRDNNRADSAENKDQKQTDTHSGSDGDTITETQPEKDAKPKRRSSSRAEKDQAPEQRQPAEVGVASVDEKPKSNYQDSIDPKSLVKAKQSTEPASDGPPKRGWWQKRSG